ALSQPIQTTPAKPTTRPTMRSAVIRSPSQSHASVAAKSGVAELRIAESPVVIESAAYEKQRNGSAEFMAPTTAIVRQLAASAPSSPRSASSGTRKSAAPATRTNASATGPNAGAAM